MSDSGRQKNRLLYNVMDKPISKENQHECDKTCAG